jgi:hypothetical protein
MVIGVGTEPGELTLNEPPVIVILSSTASVKLPVAAIATAGKQSIRNDRANAQIFAKRIGFFSEFMIIFLVEIMSSSARW